MVAEAAFWAQHGCWMIVTVLQLFHHSLSRDNHELRKKTFWLDTLIPIFITDGLELVWRKAVGPTVAAYNEYFSRLYQKN